MRLIVSSQYEMVIVNQLNILLLDALKAKVTHFDNGISILKDKINKPLIRKQKCMRLERGLYSPCLDVAVGPYAFPGYRFAIWDDDRYEDLLDVQVIKRFVQRLKGIGHVLPQFNASFNQNPRCLFAIEIENYNNYKHMLGSITNCSIMGKIGIYIDYNSERLQNFYNFLREMILRKKTRLFQNVIFFTKEEFDNFLDINQRNMR